MTVIPVFTEKTTTTKNHEVFVNPKKTFLLKARTELRRSLPILADEHWDFPYFHAYYRVQGPLKLKSVKSRINIKLFIFVMRLDEGEEYRYSSAFDCSACVEKIQTLPNRHGQAKSFLVTLKLKSVDTTNFYTYNLKEFQGLPKSQVYCLRPDVDDICQVIYTPGDPNLEYQGIITSWISNNYVFPSYTPPAERFGDYLHPLKQEQQKQQEKQEKLEEQGKSQEQQLAFLLDQIEQGRGDQLICRVIPSLYSSDEKLESSYVEHAFYLRLNLLSSRLESFYNGSGKHQSERFIGQIASVSSSAQLAKAYQLTDGLPTSPHLPIAIESPDYKQLFARDGLVRLIRSDEYGFIEHVLGPQTPKNGIFPYSPFH